MKRKYGLLRFGAEHSVRVRNSRDCRIIDGYSVKARLNGIHIVSDISESQRRPRIRRYIDLHGRVIDYFYIVAVIILKHFVRRISSVRKTDRSPLRQTAAGDRRSVAILREERFDRALTVDIGKFIDKRTDISEYFSSVKKSLIVLRIIRYVEIIPLTAIPFRVYPVQSKRYYCINIRAQRSLGPCRIKFARSDVFNIIDEIERHIRRV